MPTGPLLSDSDLLSGFVDTSRTGHSQLLHIEEVSLLRDRMQAVAIRVATGCILVRTDVDCPEVVEGIAALGLKRQMADPPLATVISLQTLGLPAASWDLWCFEHVDGRRQLEESVLNGVDRKANGVN